MECNEGDWREVKPSENWTKEEVEELIDSVTRLKRLNESLQERLRYLESFVSSSSTVKVDSDDLSKVKLSKWSKMKGALRFDKSAEETRPEEMSSLKVPQSPSNPSTSPSPIGSVFSDRPLSSSSSEEDLEGAFGPAQVCSAQGDSKERRKSLESDPCLERKKSVKSSKEYKTPWSKVKGIIHNSGRAVGVKRRAPNDEVEEKQELSFQGIYEADTSESEKRLAPALTVTVPSLEELPLSQEPRKRAAPVKSVNKESDMSPTAQRKSKWLKVKKVFLPSPSGPGTRSSSAPCSPIRTNSFVYDLESDVVSNIDFLDFPRDKEQDSVQEEIQRNYRQLQAKLNEEFQRKVNEWEKGKQYGTKSFGGNSGVSSGNSSVGDEPNQERLLRGERRQLNLSPAEDNLSPDFRKKLEEWDKIKGGNLIEGKKIKVTSTGKDKSNSKELAWLKKELQKIDREKQKLERERERLLVREAKLKKLRLAVSSRMRKQELLIPTSSGMFRFEGISRKFTRKLFEWEMAQGIRPEASTFALLDPGYKLTLTGPSHGSNDSGLVRSKSVGSVADLGNTGSVTHQPSSLSLNDMDELSSARIHAQESVSEDLSDPNGNAELPEAGDNDLAQSYGYCPLSTNIEAIRLSSPLHQGDYMTDQRDENVSVSSGPERLTEDYYKSNASETFEEMDLSAEMVDKIKDYQASNYVLSSPGRDQKAHEDFWEPEVKGDADLSFLLGTVNELLQLAYKLENKLITEKYRYLWRSRWNFFGRRRHSFSELRRSPGCSATFPKNMDRQKWHNDELFDIQNLLTNKILELKCTLNYFSQQGVRARKCSTMDYDTDSSQILDNAYMSLESRESNMIPQEIDRDNECSSPASSFCFTTSFLEPYDSQVFPHKGFTYSEMETPTGIEAKPSTSGYCEYNFSGDYYTPYQETINECDSQEEVSQDYYEGTTSELITPRRQLCFSDGIQSWEETHAHDVRLSDIFVPTTKKTFSPVYETGTTLNDLSIVGIIEKSDEDDEELVETEEETPKEGVREKSASPVSLPPPAPDEIHEIFTEAPKTPEPEPETSESNLVADLKTGEESEPLLLPGCSNVPHTPEDEDCSIPESLRQRALKIQKAKEEFLSRGAVAPPSSFDDPEDVNWIMVSEEHISNFNQLLIVRSASEGMVDQNNDGKKKGFFSGVAARLRHLRKSSRPSSSLSRQSQNLENEPDEESKSCPSPGLLRANDSRWFKRPKRILFRPKGKYTINNY